MNKELCLKLKEAGFEQIKKVGASFYIGDDACIITYKDSTYGWQFTDDGGNVCHPDDSWNLIKIPSTKDIQKALPKEIEYGWNMYYLAVDNSPHFKQINYFYYDQNGLYAIFDMKKERNNYDFHNPNEGLAQLWLLLKGKGLL